MAGDQVRVEGNALPGAVVFVVALVGLYFTTWVNYLLFHSLAEIFSIVVAFVYLKQARKPNPAWVMAVYLVVSGLLIASIFYWKVFPACFTERQGLTPFKKISEYVICAILGAAIYLLGKNRERFEPRVFVLLLWSLVCTIVSELASQDATIRLSGSPPEFIPQLHSPDGDEQVRLSNHTALIRTLPERWTKYSADYFDRLVREVTRRLTGANPLTSIVAMRLEDHLESRGRSASAMVQAAVCQAVHCGRSGYIDEFAAPNAPALV